MSAKRTLYELAVAAVALILITATVAGYFYVEYSNANSDNSQLTSELNGANGRYSSLASNYNLLLASYNESISLLSESIAVMNTSLPAYQQASARLSALWTVYQSLSPAPKSLLRNSVLFDFGNGTRHWYNDTAINAGWNVYIETVVLMNGQVTGNWYPAFSEHFVTGIGGVPDTASEYWFLWSFNKTAGWTPSLVGADAVFVTSGSVFAWTYCKADANFNPACTL